MPITILENTLFDKVKRVKQGFPGYQTRAVRLALEPTMQKSMSRTPVDRGWLRDSHRVVVQLEDRSVVGIITVGQINDPRVHYAAYVHENPKARHPVGQWKFLESSLMEDRKDIGRLIAEGMDVSQMKA